MEPVTRRVARAIGVVFAVAVVTPSMISFDPGPQFQVRNVTNSFDKPGAQASGVLYWIPDSASLSKMPVGGSDDACSARFTKWLNHHGSRVLSPQDFLVTNTSTTTENIHISFRATSKRSFNRPGFYLQCGYVSNRADIYRARGGLHWSDVNLDISNSHATRRKVDQADGVAFHQRVRPGEQLGISVFMKSGREVRGSLQFSQSSGTTPSIQVPVLAWGSMSTTVDWPGVVDSAEVRALVQLDAEGRPFLTCTWRSDDPGDSGDYCPSAELRRRIKIDHQSLEPYTGNLLDPMLVSEYVAG